MQVGDLVQIEKWCINKGRRAIVVEVPEYLSCVKIIYTDNGQCSNAMKANLILLSSLDISLT